MASAKRAPVLGYGDLGSSLLFIFPLFLLYGVGVAFAPAMNGVDFVSKNLFAAVGHDRTRYLLVYAGLASLFLVALALFRRKRIFDSRRFPPMLLESAIYALTLGSLIIFVMRNLLGFDPQLATGGLASTLVLSVGAGVHEELVFRLGMFSGGAAVLIGVGLAPRLALAVAVAGSSLAFSAAHHLGAAGDPWALGVFVYRALAGVLFAAIYYFRSLAHAVYTHALYDIYVLILR
jgi:hypothetical protein